MKIFFKQLNGLITFLYGTVVYFMYTFDPRVLKNLKQTIRVASKNPEFIWYLKD